MPDLSDFTAEQLEEFFTYLDGLRVSGVTNMMGAGEWLRNEFDLERRGARDVLSAWMQTFDDTPVAERVAKAAS